MKRSYNSIDELGNCYGKLTVVGEAGHSARGLRLWECKCECGGSLITPGYYLRQRRKRSCGCTTMRKKGSENPKWSGYEGISGSYWHRLRAGAKARNLIFAVDIEDMWKLFLIQDGKCALTGLELSFCPSDKDTRSDLTLQTASVDRIDNSIGYIISNVQWVHKDVNSMKQSFGEDYFIELCSLVVKTRQSCG